jgi:hypothetical protein
MTKRAPRWLARNAEDKKEIAGDVSIDLWKWYIGFSDNHI